METMHFELKYFQAGTSFHSVYPKQSILYSNIEQHSVFKILGLYE